jgi:CTP:molybdopterin cytidylyltransferase MocA
MLIPVIVLAAGASRRLGEPKQLVKVDGETLLERTLRVVREAGLEAVYVVLGANAERIEAAVDLSSVFVVVNADWESGLATSIHAGVQAAGSEADGVMLLVCDQPRLSVGHLCRLIEKFERQNGAVIVASEYAGMVGIPAVFPAGWFPALLSLEGDSGARKILREASDSVLTVDFDGGEVDVDTPADVEALGRGKL